MAVTETVPPPAKGPSLVIQIAVLLVLTLAALGLGWVTGNRLGGEVPAAAPGTAASAEAGREASAQGGHGAAAAGGHGEAKSGEPAAGPAEFNPKVIALAPLTTNLAAPSDIWVRLEAAIVVDGEAPADLPDTIHQDMLAFIRTVKLHQIEGASGFRHFKADLQDRAATRSSGLVTQVLIRTLLFE